MTQNMWTYPGASYMEQAGSGRYQILGGACLRLVDVFRPKQHYFPSLQITKSNLTKSMQWQPNVLRRLRCSLLFTLLKNTLYCLILIMLGLADAARSLFWRSLPAEYLINSPKPRYSRQPWSISNIYCILIPPISTSSP